MDIAEIAIVTSTVLAIAVAGLVAFVALGIYRARHQVAREAQYRTLAEHSAAGTEATATELQGVRDELGQVRQRLTALEKLLSQIG